MDRRQFLILTGSAALGSACGGGSGPTGPSTPPPAGGGGALPTPTTLTFIDGLDHNRLIAGLAVTAGGALATTGPGGTVTAVLQNGSGIAATGRPEYLGRETLFAAGTTTFPLWPLAPYWDPAYVNALVYDYSGGDPNDTTWDYLWRPEPGTYTVSVSPEIRNDQSMLGRVNVAIDRGARLAMKGNVAFRWADEGTNASLTFEIESDPAHPILGDSWALFFPNGSLGVFRGGRIVMGREHAGESDVALHEIGHFLGFQHSIDRRDVMYVGRGRDDNQEEFSPNEEDAWELMRQRKPRNTFPDRDPSIAGAARIGIPPPIVCRRSPPLR